MKRPSKKCLYYIYHVNGEYIPTKNDMNYIEAQMKALELDNMSENYNYIVLSRKYHILISENKISFMEYLFDLHDYKKKGVEKWIM